MKNPRTLFAIALLAELIGAAGVLLAAGRSWQTIAIARPRPLADAVVNVSGQTLDGAITGVALVALAGVVAVLATRGLGRRIVGALVALSGVVIIWRAAGGFTAVSADRARELVTSALTGVGVDATSTPQVTVHAAWPALVIACGSLIVAAGVLVVARGSAWSAMAARYEAPTAAAKRDRGSDDIAMWTALDRGDDPTRTEL